jgi:ATP-dependent Clp protease ATP-binding subunit ClpB
VAETILRSRAGMSRPNQPNGSFLFLGSTGTGKTETAKALAQSLFDSEKHMIRLDMSEYSEQHSVARMIGSPPGYVGHDEGGQLTEAVRRQPYSVILMDEVEKAHPLVLNILLQVLDDGRLTDGKGRVVDFSNTIVILTSNLGANYLNSGGGSGVVTDAEKQQVMQAVRAHFRPEFLNRLDEIVIFSPLGKDQLRQIAAIQLRQVTDRLLERNISVTATNKALDFILASSYDPAYGARPVRRFVEKVVGTDISRMLLRAELIDDNKLTIDSDGKEFVYGVDSNKIEQKNKKVKVEKMKL